MPVLGSHSVTDPNLYAVPAQVNGGVGYLQTSPEYFLKRLLAAGSGCLFYLGKAFRNDEYGRRHRPEFTMLEWYRLGFTDQQLIEETLALLGELMPTKPARQVRYGELFEQQLGVNPHRVDDQQLAAIAKSHAPVNFNEAPRATWLDLLFSHCLEPTLTGVVVVSDYPSVQGALAKIKTDANGDKVARRFEVFVDGVELANGYWELTDAWELQKRFEQDQRQCQAQGRDVPAIDQELLDAHSHGLPECAGIALGVDRLVMAVLGLKDIDQAVAFSPFNRD